MSSSLNTVSLQHVAIIMDGNGRWARSLGKTRTEGHKVGANVASDISKHAVKQGVRYLTLYAFSSENWNRPKVEVDFLMRLLKNNLKREKYKLKENNIRLRVIGDLKRLPEDLQLEIILAEQQTQECTGLNLQIALSYGSRQEIVAAFRDLAKSHGTNITLEDVEQRLYTKGMPDPDLLIRTGGEQRISNFLLWQMAYTELFFSDKFWPDFTTHDFDLAIADYNQRQRRYGKII